MCACHMLTRTHALAHTRQVLRQLSIGWVAASGSVSTALAAMWTSRGSLSHERAGVWHLDLSSQAGLAGTLLGNRDQVPALIRSACMGGREGGVTVRVGSVSECMCVRESR